MRLLLTICILFGLINQAGAADFTTEAKVDQLLVRSHTSSPSTWVTVRGFQDHENCRAVASGLTALYLENNETGERQLSLLLAAKVADVPVLVRVDDQVKNPDPARADYCMLKYVSIR